MISKLFVLSIMLTIIATLGSGLYCLMTNQNDGNRLVKTLTWRIALSLSLFALLFVGYYLGLLHPHGL